MISPIPYTMSSWFLWLILVVILPLIAGIWYIFYREFILASLFFSVAILCMGIILLQDFRIDDEIPISDYHYLFMRINNNPDYMRALQAYVTKHCEMNEDNYRNFINLISSNKADQYIKGLTLPKSAEEVNKMCS